MKKIYLMLFLFAIAFSSKIQAQVTLIDNNHDLSGYPIFSNSIFATSDIDSSMWTSNGEPGGSTKLAVNVKTNSEGGGLLNNKLYFSGLDAAHGSELWVTDGTAGGTKLVQDLIPGSASSNPEDFFVFKNDLYFTDSTQASGRELYKLNGTSGTISLFKEINPGSASAFHNSNGDFFSNNNLMYFTADDGVHGTELWVSDGTAANTKMLSDITAGSGSTTFGQFAGLGTSVIFGVYTATYSLDLYKTNGSTVTLIKSFNIPYSGLGAIGFLNFNNKIYFGGTDADHGTELWSTDGNTATMVKDINPGSDPSTPLLFNAVFINNRFLFAAADANGTELWSSDGTAANTVMVKDINPGTDGSDPELMPSINYSRIFNLGETDIFDIYDRSSLLNGYIFLTADDGVHGKQLWKTNGTTAGTVVVQNIGDGSQDVGDSYFYTKTGLYFAADDGTHGLEPWFTDGSTASMVYDINPGTGSSNPEFSFIFNNKLFCTADNGDSPSGFTDLYRIDATASTLPIRLLNFKATLQTDAVKLDWTTATEINSSNFVIQRSIDGIHFSDIATVNAAGNSTIEKSYSYNDEQYLSAGSNVLFYRLQLNDKDGNYQYSQVQNVKLNAATTILKTYPNPVHDQLSVLFSTASSKAAALKITDVNGKQVYQQKYDATKSTRLQNIDVSGFAKGTYFVQLITDTGSKTTKFVKE